MLIVAAVCFLNSFQPTETSIVDHPSKRDTIEESAIKSKIRLVSKINTSKNVLRYTFADDSNIYLQPGSVIQHRNNFSRYTKREIQLYGETCFEVSEDSEKPFIVYANNLIENVLETTFNIKSFEDSPSIEVELFTGKVSVKVFA